LKFLLAWRDLDLISNIRGASSQLGKHMSRRRGRREHLPHFPASPPSQLLEDWVA